MGNYTISRDENSGVITCRFKGTIAYRHLLQSVEELKKSLSTSGGSILLDFSSASRIPVSHSQMLAYHQCLRVLLPDDIVAKIAVIKPPENAWHPGICGGTRAEGMAVSQVLSKCFSPSDHPSAVQWLEYQGDPADIGINITNLRS